MSTHEDTRGVFVPFWMIESAPTPQAALLLAQIAWLAQRSMRGGDRARVAVRDDDERWLALSDHELAEHLHMSSDAVYRLRIVLKRAGLVQCKVAKVDGIKRSLILPTPPVDVAESRDSAAAESQDGSSRDSAASFHPPESDELETGESGRVAALARLDEWPENLPNIALDSGLLESARDLGMLLESTLLERGFTDVAGKAIGKRWLLDMEALLRVDERPVEQVRWVIRWLDRGDDKVSAFWRSNVRSPKKLRLHWAVMREQYHALQRTTQSRTGQQFDRAVREAGHDPTEVAADTDALVREMFGTDHHESSDGNSVTSVVLDVDSREESA